MGSLGHMGLCNRALGPGGCREAADFFVFGGIWGGAEPPQEGSGGEVSKESGVLRAWGAKPLRVP